MLACTCWIPHETVMALLPSTPDKYTSRELCVKGEERIELFDRITAEDAARGPPLAPAGENRDRPAEKRADCRVHAAGKR